MPLIIAALLATGCASADHSWRGEFDARLEGASAEIEEQLGNLRSGSTELEMFRATDELAHQLATEAELIEALDPPATCDEVQEEGRRKVSGGADFSSILLKNLTPDLRRKLPGPFKERAAELKALEREAASCESG